MRARALRLEHSPFAKDGKKIKVEETADYWIVPDCILTTDGVMNGARKRKEELAKTWLLADGIPFVHLHPGDDEHGLVIDQRRIGGFVTNIRFNDKTGDVVGDRYLLKHSVDGLHVTPENVEKNRELVADLRAGEPRETSIGFWSTDTAHDEPKPYDGPNQEFAGQAYDREQSYIVYDHDAAVPRGACGERCTFGRAQQQDHDHAPKGGLQDQEKQTMAKIQDCEDGKLLLDRIAKLEQERQDAAKAPAASADAIAKAVQEALKPVAEKIAAIEARTDAAEKARVDGKITELATLLVPKGADKTALDAKLAELAGTPEKALDTLIANEKAKTTRADGFRAYRGGAQASDEREQDGMTVSADGFTVTNAEALIKSVKPKVS